MVLTTGAEITKEAIIENLKKLANEIVNCRCAMTTEIIGV